MRAFLNKDKVSSFDVKVSKKPFNYESVIRIYYDETNNVWYEDVISDRQRVLKGREKTYESYRTIGDILNLLQSEFDDVELVDVVDKG